VNTHAQYLVIRGANWVAANDTGTRLIAVRSVEGARDQTNIINSIKGKVMYQQLITVERYDVGEIIECYASQNSGTNIKVYAYIYTITLKRL